MLSVFLLVDPEQCLIMRVFLVSRADNIRFLENLENIESIEDHQWLGGQSLNWQTLYLKTRTKFRTGR